MRKTFSFLLALLAIMSVTVVVASASSEKAEYTYTIDGTEYNVEFMDTNASPEKQEMIALKLVGLYDGGAQTYGLGCVLFGHDLQYTTTNVVKHKVRTAQPRCLQETYEIEYCEDCDYSKSTLLYSKYINCCS